MNQTAVAIVIGVAVAAGTVLLLDGLRVGGGADLQSADLAAIESRLAAIEGRLGGDDGPAGLSTQAVHPDLLRRLERIEGHLAAIGELRGAPTAAGDGAEPAGPLTRIADRLTAIEEKLGEGSDRSSDRKPTPRKRRVSLAEAADALELSVQEQDDLKRAYDAFHEKMFKIAAGKDGNPDDVRREVLEAKGNPMKAAGLMSKYLPNVMGDIGGLMSAQAEREEAIKAAIGPEKAARLDREFDVKEDNMLGLGGGFRTEMRMDGDGR